MTTKLNQSIRREIDIDGEPYTILLTPRGIQLNRKRFRHGRALSWRALWELSELERPDSPKGPSGRRIGPAITEHPDPARRT